jgi:hypothetical protein
MTFKTHANRNCRPRKPFAIGGTDRRDDGRQIPPLLVSAREAARLLSISESRLRERTKDGTLPVVRLNGRVLHHAAAVYRDG